MKLASYQRTAQAWSTILVIHCRIPRMKVSHNFSFVAIFSMHIYIFFTDSTPPRKDTGVFESLGRFIGSKCHNYALYIFIYIYIHITANSS